MTESQQDVLEQAPGAAPGCVHPSIPQTSPASPSHGITTSASRLHMQAACMASLLHHPAPQPEPSAPWLLWLLFLAPLGNPLPGCSEGERVLAGSGSCGCFPRVLAGVRTPDTGPASWEGRAGAACSLPWGEGHRTVPGSLVPDWQGPAHAGSGWHHQWAGAEAAECPWTPAVLGGREGPCQSATGWREPALSPAAPSHRATVSQGSQAPTAPPLAQPLTASLLQPGPTDPQGKGGLWGSSFYFFPFFFLIFFSPSFICFHDFGSSFPCPQLQEVRTPLPCSAHTAGALFPLHF